MSSHFIMNVYGTVRLFDEPFADEQSALDFALRYLPENADFKIVQVSTTTGTVCPVISLCDYRRSKYGTAV
jgi:hypothetical protein